MTPFLLRSLAAAPELSAAIARAFATVTPDDIQAGFFRAILQHLYREHL